MLKTILLDWNRTLYNPETTQLYPDAIEFLKSLRERKRKCKIFIISTGEIPVIIQIKNYAMPHVDDFVIADKTPELFLKIVQDLPPQQVIVIGDSISQEIKIANQLGNISVRLLRGKYQFEKPSDVSEIAQYSIRFLQEIFSLPLSF